jgi:hypothetical protein
MDNNPGKTSTENINEVILRLLKLKTGTELDYQTYFQILKKKLTIHAVFAGNKLPQEEQDLLIDELNRIRKIKDKEQKRFKIKEKKVKVSSAASPKTGPRRPPSGSGGGGGSPPKTGSIVKAKSGKITADNYYYQNYVEPVNVKDVTKKTAKVSKQTDPLTRISDTLDSILNTLTNINKFDREQATRQRTDAENRRRGQRETDLESKSFEGIKKALSAITKPFQSIWDRIVNFITNVILGRIVIKLLEWFGDSKNQEKIQSIIRFLGDHWPTLLALYLRFGTSIGRFVGKLTRSLVKGSFKLVKLVAGLAAKLGLKRAGKLASFIGGPRGRAVATGVGIAADVAVTAGTAFGASKLFGGEDKKQEPVAPEPVQQFSGGGAVRIPKFAGGGFANFGNMFKGAGFGSMFGPMGMLAGAALGSGIPQEMFSGLVKGPGGPKEDKIVANLSNGEFVMSAGAVKKYGVGTLEAMNAAGGGDNKPKIVDGTTYAAGGGMIGETPKEIRLRQAYESKLGKDLISKLTNKQISEISKYYNSLSNIESSEIDSKIIKGMKNSLTDMIEKMISGVSHTGGGYMGDYMKDQVKMRTATTDEMTGKSYKLQHLLGAKNQEEVARLVSLSGNKVPDIESLIGKDEFLRFNMGHIGKGAEGADEKTFKGLQRIYQQHFGVGKEFEKMMSNRVDAKMLNRSTTPKPTSTLKPKIPTLASELSPSYFLRGQSSLLPENYFSRSPINSNSIGNWTDAEKRLLGINDQSVFDRSQLDATRSTPKINSNSSFNRYRPGATIRATGPGMQNFPELQGFAGQSGTMKPNSPRIGGRIQRLAGQPGTMIPRNGSNKMSAMAKLLNNPALRFAGKAARVLDAPVIGDMILPEGSSEYDQRSNAYNDPRLSPVQRRIMMESVGLRGGAMKGGLGLKDQSFKDAPKTQIMTDDKGRPFVGYKALRSGKLTYIRGPQSGAGSSNMWENFGRMINPGAYKDIDKLNTRKKYEEASRNSVSSLKSRGASQATISRTQTKLNRSVPPLPKPKPKPQVAGGGMGGRRGGRSRPSSGSKAPSFNAKHSSGTFVSASSYGIMR